MLNPEIDYDSCEKIVIRCLITEDEQLKLSNAPLSESGMGICHKVLDTFIKKEFNNNEKLKQLENINLQT